MGYYECFGSGFTALSLKKLYKKANILNLCWQQFFFFYKDLPTSDSRSICFLPKKISLHPHSSLEFSMDNFCDK